MQRAKLFLQNNHSKKSGDMAQAKEYLPCKQKALSSNSHIIKKNSKTRI
jgi:hypothetical protein